MHRHDEHIGMEVNYVYNIHVVTALNTSIHLHKQKYAF